MGAEGEQVKARVSGGSTLGKVFFTLLYLGAKRYDVLVRVRPGEGKRAYGVNYRHVIRSPQCKPMALKDWVHRDQLFPRDRRCGAEVLERPRLGDLIVRFENRFSEVAVVDAGGGQGRARLLCRRTVPSRASCATVIAAPCHKPTRPLGPGPARGTCDGDGQTEARLFLRFWFVIARVVFGKWVPHAERYQIDTRHSLLGPAFDRHVRKLFRGSTHQSLNEAGPACRIRHAESSRDRLAAPALPPQLNPQQEPDPAHRQGVGVSPIVSHAGEVFRGAVQRAGHILYRAQRSLLFRVTGLNAQPDQAVTSAARCSASIWGSVLGHRGLWRNASHPLDSHHPKSLLRYRGAGTRTKKGLDGFVERDVGRRSYFLVVGVHGCLGLG